MNEKYWLYFFLILSIGGIIFSSYCLITDNSDLTPWVLFYAFIILFADDIYCKYKLFLLEKP